MNTRALLDDIADELEALGRPQRAAQLRALPLGGRPRAKRVKGYTERDWWLAELHCQLKARINGGEREVDVLAEASNDASITDKLSEDIADRFTYLARLLDLDGSFHRLRPLIRNLSTEKVCSTFFSPVPR